MPIKRSRQAPRRRVSVPARRCLCLTLLLALASGLAYPVSAAAQDRPSTCPPGWTEMAGQCVRPGSVAQVSPDSAWSRYTARVTQGGRIVHSPPTPVDRQTWECVNGKTDGGSQCSHNSSTDTVTINKWFHVSPCRGPYTVEVDEGTRVDGSGRTYDAADKGTAYESSSAVVENNRIRLTNTSPGNHAIPYTLYGTVTHTASAHEGLPRVTETAECILTGVVIFEVNERRRSGVRNDVIAHYAVDADVDLRPGEELSHEQWSTPSGCVIVVTGAKRGYSASHCMSRSELEGWVDEHNQGTNHDIDLNDIPACPADGSRPARNEHCLATNR